VEDDVPGSAHLGIEDLRDIIYTENQALATEVKVMIGSGGSYEELIDLLTRLLLNDTFEARVLDSVSRISGRGWQPPSAVQYKRKQRL
jgi:hypothetical protein